METSGLSLTPTGRLLETPGERRVYEQAICDTTLGQALLPSVAPSERILAKGVGWGFFARACVHALGPAERCTPRAAPSVPHPASRTRAPVACVAFSVAGARARWGVCAPRAGARKR